MAVQQADSVRNAQADAWETALGTTPAIRLFAGTPPADETAALSSNTLLAAATADWSPASGGAKSLTATATDTAANATGLATFYRIYGTPTNADTGGTSLEQGLVAMGWTASTPVVVGQQVVNPNTQGGNVYRCTTGGTTASSGGPTGTAGSGITDGTAVWGYVGTCDMIIDNVSIATGQQVQIPTFTKTWPG